MSRRKVSFNEAIAKVVATKERDAKRAAMFGELVEALQSCLDDSRDALEKTTKALAKAKELQ